MNDYLVDYWYLQHLYIYVGDLGLFSAEGHCQQVQVASSEGIRICVQWVAGEDFGLLCKR